MLFCSINQTIWNKLYIWEYGACTYLVPLCSRVTTLCSVLLNVTRPYMNPVLHGRTALRWASEGCQWHERTLWKHISSASSNVEKCVASLEQTLIGLRAILKSIRLRYWDPGQITETWRRWYRGRCRDWVCTERIGDAVWSAQCVWVSANGSGWRMFPDLNQTAASGLLSA